jgi:hypothetical protein
LDRQASQREEYQNVQIGTSVPDRLLDTLPQQLNDFCSRESLGQPQMKTAFWPNRLQKMQPLPGPPERLEVDPRYR